MLIHKPEFIFIADETSTVRKSIEKIIRQPFQQPNSNNRFQTKNTNDTIINAVKNAVDFVNNVYGHNFQNLLPIQIIGEISKRQNGLKDSGGLYRQDKQIDGSDGIIQLSTDFLNHQNKYSNSNFAKHLNNNLGLANFTKLVAFHEIAHHMDYLLKSDMLVAIYKNHYQKLSHTDFINEPEYQNVIKSWSNNISQETKHIDMEKHFKRNLKENFADCWSCLLLCQESKQKGIHLKKVVDVLKKARSIDATGPADIYSTHNALNRMLINISSLPPNQPSDVVKLIEKSSQEGLVLNIQQIFKINAEQMSEKIKDNLFPSMSQEQAKNKIQETVKRLKI